MPSPQITARAQEIIDESSEFGEQLWEELETIIKLRHTKRKDDYEDLTIADLCLRVAERMAGEEE